MKPTYFLLTLLMTGCATATSPSSSLPPDPLPQKVAATHLRTPEQLAAYPVGRYPDPDDATILHEAHMIYRAESSPSWNTDDVLPGPGEASVAPPAPVALTAELEEKLRQEQELLQATTAQNERLAQEIQALDIDAPKLRALLTAPVPEPKSSPTSAPQSVPQVNQPATQPSPASSPQPKPSTRTWSQWLESFSPKTNK